VGNSEAKMTINTTKTGTKLDSVVEFINEEDAKALFGKAAFASVLMNPTVTWAKFTLTDDRVNGNMQRIPDSEFENLIRTGINMPIKMAVGEISPGHSGTEPLGVMTHLKTIVVDAGYKAIIALAALWAEERPADVAYLKDKFNKGEPINVSWEILYQDAVYNPTENSMDLQSTILKAATIVGEPAYGGRTQFLSVAAKKWSKAYADDLPNSHFLYIDETDGRHLPVADSEGKLDRAKLKEALVGLAALDLPISLLREKRDLVNGLLEKFDAGESIDEVSNSFFGSSASNLEEHNVEEIEQLKIKLSDAQSELDTVKATLAEKETALAESETAKTELTRLTELVASQETELVTLREFKASLDAEVALQEKLASIKAKFSEAGVTKDEEYFKQNSEILLALPEASLDLFVSEAKAAASKPLENSQAGINTQIPALSGEENGEQPTIKDLAKYLRDSKAKK
jgi:hypothetical protein